MSKYTTEVRFICEHSAGLTDSAGYSAIDEVIGKAIPNVFSFNFPIFDEAYRNVLCRKILKHYYTREICEESVGLWKLRLDTRMNEIMPYYNQLYKSELLEFNPLYDTNLTRTSQRQGESTGSDAYSSNKDITGNSVTDTTNSGTNKSTTNETSEGTANGSSKATSNVTSEGSVTGTNQSTTNATNESSGTGTNENNTTANKTNTDTGYDLYSDTPQGALTNVDNEEYLTNARKKTTNGTNTEQVGVTGSTSTTENVTSSSTTSGNTSTTTNDSGASTTTSNESNSTTGKVDTVVNGETSGTGKSTTISTGNDKFTSNQNRDARTTEDYLETVLGKQGSASYSKLLNEYRETFLNIDMQVINALSDLFFGLW